MAGLLSAFFATGMGTRGFSTTVQKTPLIPHLPPVNLSSVKKFEFDRNLTEVASHNMYTGVTEAGKKLFLKDTSTHKIYPAAEIFPQNPKAYAKFIAEKEVLATSIAKSLSHDAVPATYLVSKNDGSYLFASEEIKNYLSLGDISPLSDDTIFHVNNSGITTARISTNPTIFIPTKGRIWARIIKAFLADSDPNPLNVGLSLPYSINYMTDFIRKNVSISYPIELKQTSLVSMIDFGCCFGLDIDEKPEDIAFAAMPSVVNELNIPSDDFKRILTRTSVKQKILDEIALIDSSDMKKHIQSAFSSESHELFGDRINGIVNLMEKNLQLYRNARRLHEMAVGSFLKPNGRGL